MSLIRKKIALISEIHSHRNLTAGALLRPPRSLTVGGAQSILRAFGFGLPATK
jgi:hypothetical protein